MANIIGTRIKLIVVLLLYFHLVPYSQTYNYDRILNITWKKFEDNKIGYKLFYPSGWKLNRNANLSTSIFVEKGNEIEAGIEVFPAENNNDTSLSNLEKLRETLLKNVKSRPNFKLVESKFKNLNQHHGVFLSFSNTKTKADYPTIHTAIWLLSKGHFTYRIMYISNDEAYAKYEQTSDDIFDSFCFLDEAKNFNASILKGRWEGTITELPPDSSIVKPAPITIVFENHNDSTEDTKITQLVYQFKSGKFDTLHSIIAATIFDELLMIPYNKKGIGGSSCSVKLMLNYTYRDGVHYLEGENKMLESIGYYYSGTGSYCPVSLTLRKVDKNDLVISPETLIKVNSSSTISTTNRRDPILKKEDDEELSLAASVLFNTVYRYNSANNIASGETIQLDMSNKDKNKLVESSGLTLSPDDNTSFVDKSMKVPFKVSVEACDLNEDGLFELILRKYNQAGSQKTNPFSIFRKPNDAYSRSHASTIPYKEILKGFGVPIVQDERVNEYHSIVVAKSDGVTGLSYDYNGFYDFAGQVLLPNKANPYLKNSVGGDSPDDLGRKLLRALQTNDEKLWLSCMHPADIRYRNSNENSFQQHRIAFNQAGLTQWGLTKFSRVTFSREDAADDPLKSGEKRCNLFKIEFTYKNMEYLGITSYMLIKTYNNKKYFVYGATPACKVQLLRYRKPQ